MSDVPSITGNVLVALIVAMPPTILSVATFITSRAAAAAAKEAKTTAETVAVKAKDDAALAVTDRAALASKTEEIHVLVNSNLTAVKVDLELANNKIIAMQQLIEKLTGDKIAFDVVAASNIQAGPVGTVGPVGIVKKKKNARRR